MTRHCLYTRESGPRRCRRNENQDSPRPHVEDILYVHCMCMAHRNLGGKRFRPCTDAEGQKHSVDIYRREPIFLIRLSAKPSSNKAAWRGPITSCIREDSIRVVIEETSTGIPLAQISGTYCMCITHGDLEENQFRPCVETDDWGTDWGCNLQGVTCWRKCLLRELLDGCPTEGSTYWWSNLLIVLLMASSTDWWSEGNKLTMDTITERTQILRHDSRLNTETLRLAHNQYQCQHQIEP